MNDDLEEEADRFKADYDEAVRLDAKIDSLLALLKVAKAASKVKRSELDRRYTSIRGLTKPEFDEVLKHIELTDTEIWEMTRYG